MDDHNQQQQSPQVGQSVPSTPPPVENQQVVGTDRNRSGMAEQTQPINPSVPDLTATQQVIPPFPEQITKQPSVSSATQNTMSPTKPPKKKQSGLPKGIFIGIVGFVLLLGVFILLKMFGSGFNGGGNGHITLTYWGLWEDKNVMQGIIADFEKQHPNITINYLMQDPHEYTKSLLTRIKNGTGPDIFRYHISWLPMLEPDLLPLSTDAITTADFDKAYYPVMQQDLIKNGAIYGIPLEVDTLALFINKKIFTDSKAQVPTTWDSFISTAQALTQKDGNGKIQVAGAALGAYNNVTHAPDILSLLFVQNGVNLKTMTPASNASDALTFYTSFVKDQNNVWDTTLDPSLLAFEKGKLAMYIGYSWDIFAIQAADPNLEFAIYPVPHLPGRNMTIASYWVEGVSSKTTHPKEAMAFMHYLAQKDTATKLYTAEAKTRAFGELYSRIDLAPLLKDNPLVYPFVLQAANASSALFAGDTQDSGIDAQLNQYLGNAINATLGTTSADSAITDLTAGVSQVLQQYGQ